MSEPSDLLGEAPLDAAIAALASRNRHHLDAMTETERNDALGHWRELAVTVLMAATAAGADPDGEAVAPGDQVPGRAVVVFEDAGGDDVNVHVSFFPELEDLGNGEAAGTPAQIAALELLNEMTGEPEPE